MRKMTCVIAAAAVLSMTGCGVAYDSMYDDVQRIVSDADSYNKTRFKQMTLNDQTTITCEKMSGMTTIWKYEADEDMELEMSHAFDVARGKAKLVLIWPDDTAVTIVEQEAASDKGSLEGDGTAPLEETVSTLELKEGLNRIKVICTEDTSFSLSFTIPKE